jgi:hypothetical protein
MRPLPSFPSLDQSAFELITNNGTAAMYAGQHSLIFSRGHGQDVTLNMEISASAVRLLY